MCSSNAVQTIADPANAFGKREGGFDMAGALDPGGEMSNAIEGKEGNGDDSFNRKLARTGDLLPDDPVVTDAYEPMTQAERKSRTTVSTNKSRASRFYKST